MITKTLAQKIKTHLLKTKQGFCFYNGMIISLERCNNILSLEKIQGQ